MSDTPSVRVTGLSKSYPSRGGVTTVLRDLSFALGRGEALAIRGRSGSGKSTLLNLLAGIDAPDAGHIEIAGQDITQLSDTARTAYRRRQVGFIYQAFFLVPVISNFDNLRLVLELNDCPKADVEDRIGQALEAVGLADRSRDFPDQLSGGEQQRIAVARALIHKPTLVLADEPTGNLDSDNAERVMHLLMSLVKESNSTLIMATHSRATAAYCDVTREISDGKINTSA